MFSKENTNMKFFQLQLKKKSLQDIFTLETYNMKTCKFQ